MTVFPQDSSDHVDPVDRIRDHDVPVGNDEGDADVAARFAPRPAPARTGATERSRAEKMAAAAVWLAEQGCYVGWGKAEDGKVVKRPWKSDKTNDPAMVPPLLAGARNALIIPAGRVVVIDIDKDGWLERLQARGLPPTFTVKTPSVEPWKVHVYGLLPEGFDPSELPGAFAGGEVRRSSAGEQSMVLGPWALRKDGVYTPLPDAPRSLAVIPVEVLDHIGAHRGGKANGEAKRDGPLGEPWRWDQAEMGSRHVHLVGQMRHWRGLGDDTVEALVAHAWRYIARHAIPLERVEDEPDIDDKELRSMAEWTIEHVDDDEPWTGEGAGNEPRKESRRSKSARIWPTVGDLFSEGVVEVPYYAVDIIPKVGLGAIVAQQKAGKTSLAMQAGFALAQPDGTFLGVPVDEQVTVWLNESEGSEDGFKARLRDVHAALGAPALGSLTMRPMFRAVSMQAGPKAGGDAMRRMIEEAGGPPKVWFVGMASRLFGFDDENSAAKVQPYLDALDDLAAEYQMLVMFSHHVRKPGMDTGGVRFLPAGKWFHTVRGSSAFVGAVDVMLGLDRDADQTDGRLNILLRNGLTRGVDVEWHYPLFSLPKGLASAAALPDDPALRAVRRVLIDAATETLSGWLSQSEVARKAEVSRPTAQRRLAMLVSYGEVEKDEPGGQQQVLYRVIPGRP